MLYISIKSTDSDLLNYFCENFLSTFKEKSLIKGPIFLPKKKKIYRVIRSSHVFSISKEEFGIIIYKRVLFFKEPFSYFSNSSGLVFKNTKLNELKNILIKNVPSGISLKLSFKDI